MYMNTAGTVCLGIDVCALYSSEVQWLHVCDVLSYITLSVCSTSWQLEMLMMMMMMTMTMVAMILMVLIILAILMILIILMILMVMPADNNGFRQVETTNIHQLIVVSGP